MRLRLLLLSLVVVLAAPPVVAKPKPKSKTPPAKVAPTPSPPPAKPVEPEPTPVELVGWVDGILSPPEFEAKLSFTTHKANGDTNTFSMSYLKKDSDKFRVRFLTPPDDAGAEVLRIKNDFWNYLPNLKRALKISAKQEFHGGDFANSDVLQIDLAQDYDPAFAADTAPDQWTLELKAKNDEVTYARVILRVRRKDHQPLAMDYYSGSGKLVRKLELSDLKAYGSVVRPTRYIMHNMLEPKRFSEMVYETFTLRKDIDGALFDQTALGR